MNPVYRYFRNLFVWSAWKLGLMDVPWYDDARIDEFEEEAREPEEEVEECPTAWQFVGGLVFVALVLAATWAGLVAFG